MCTRNSFQQFSIVFLFVCFFRHNFRTYRITHWAHVPGLGSHLENMFLFWFWTFPKLWNSLFFFPHFHFNIRNCSTAILNRKSNFLLSPKEEYVHEERKKKKNKNKNTYKEKDRIIIILNCVKSLKQQQQRKEKIICFNESAYAIACFESARAP